MDEFRKTPLHARLAYNPLYTLQRYPQAGYVPDMALPNPVGSFVYKRSFLLDNACDMPARLYCGGVQNSLAAWVNGVYLGRHEGYSAEFWLDIPEGTLREGENTWSIIEVIPAAALFNHDIDSWEGKKMHANFYKCGDNLPNPHFLSWNKIEFPRPNFHLQEFFGEVTFE